MSKQPVMDELIKLQNYIKRFCPELPNVKFSKTKYLDLSEEEQDELIAKYISNIRVLACKDDQVN